jgi:RNA polymerase sigma-70 factor, ECF subfamily
VDVVGDPLAPLVEAASVGDDRAVELLVRATQPAVARVCRALSGGDGDVDDLVQETYLRALRGINGYRGEAPFQAWLLGIARRVCADEVRRHQRGRRAWARLGDPRPTDVPAPTIADGGLLDVLDTDRREAFLLTQVAGLTYEEAADVAGCAVGTIRSRVARARAQLLAAVQQAEAV